MDKFYIYIGFYDNFLGKDVFVELEIEFFNEK